MEFFLHRVETVPPRARPIRAQRDQGDDCVTKSSVSKNVAWVYLALLACGMAGAGCTYTTSPAGSGTPIGPGTLAVRAPGSLPPSAAPPPGQAPAPPPSGIFAGTGRLSGTRAGSGCRRDIPIDGLVVTGRQVRYQGLRGTIGPNFYLEMQGGGRFLYGTFSGPRFFGTLWQPHPGCSYEIVLDHAG